MNKDQKIADKIADQSQNDPDASPPYNEGDQVVYITDYEASFTNDDCGPLLVDECYFDDMENCWYVKPKNFGGFHAPARDFKSKTEAIRLIENVFNTDS